MPVVHALPPKHTLAHFLTPHYRIIRQIVARYLILSPEPPTPQSITSRSRTHKPTNPSWATAVVAVPRAFCIHNSALPIPHKEAMREKVV